MPDLRGPEGGPTGALYGMINMLRRMRKEVTAEYSACVFDAKGKTFRDDWYADYKANRAASQPVRCAGSWRCCAE
jgi:DNA polymerase-1